MGYKIPFTADTSAYEKGLANMRNSSKQLGKQIQGSMASGKLGFLAAAGGAGLLAAASYKVTESMIGQRIEVERSMALLETATGSIEGATDAFNDLVDFAEKTPFTLNQAIQAFVTLKNLGLDPSREALESYGNTASAMGKDLTQLIEAVADAATGEFERLKEFGIKAKSVGEDVIFTFRGVETKVKKSSSEIQKYLVEMGNVNFAGSMSRQMDTMGGKIDNLANKWQKFKRNFSDSKIMTAFSTGFKYMVDDAAIALDNLGNMIGEKKEKKPRKTDQELEEEEQARKEQAEKDKAKKAAEAAERKRAFRSGLKNQIQDIKARNKQNKEKERQEGLVKLKKRVERGAEDIQNSLASVKVSSLQFIGGGGTISGTAASQIQVLRNQESLLRMIAENTNGLKESAGPMQKGAPLT